MVPEILGHYFHKICHILAEDNFRRQVDKFDNQVNIEFIQCHNQ